MNANKPQDAKDVATRILYEYGRLNPANLSYEIFRRSGITVTVAQASEIQEDFFAQLRETVLFRQEYEKDKKLKSKLCFLALLALFVLEIA